MTSCHSCTKSFAMPTDYFGGTVLVCIPDARKEIQKAVIPCEHYMREPGADEPEKVKDD